jgi:hypothetical protein
VIISSEIDTATRFAEMDQAGTGTIRLEQPDEWVVFAHFSSYEEISTHGRIKHRYCDFRFYRNDTLIADRTLRGNVAYQTFVDWVKQHTSIEWSA